MKNQKIYVEKIIWDDIKKDMKYPECDDNEGYTYGLNFTDGEGYIYEISWYKTDEERQKEIEEIKAIIIFE